MGLWNKLFGQTNTPATTHKTTSPSAVAKAPAPQIRVVFMGTPPFASELLMTLIEDGYHIVGVITKADKPVGRTQEVSVSAVKKLALEYKLPILQPEKLNDEAYAQFKEWQPDILIVAAYGKILPKRFLELPGFGAMNVHASLLPLYRGSSPIQNVILDGKEETGITLMQMDAGMDTGDIIVQKTVKISPDETVEQLTAKLTLLAQKMLSETLPLWVKKKISATPQPEKGSSLCQLIERQDGQIIWNEEARSIYNRYRALTPWPGIFTFWPQKNGLLRIKLHTISVIDDKEETSIHGTVLLYENKLAIQAERGIIIVEELQLEGRNRMSADTFLKGNPSFVGSVLK
ncbi:MAG: methionyl-tRNA formyltransferase [Candidatus Moranbacteria bacterium]|nr:methionyl-tRNA formyltransferase [Candidatus Moranbacteria bacterium]